MTSTDTSVDVLAVGTIEADLRRLRQSRGNDPVIVLSICGGVWMQAPANTSGVLARANLTATVHGGGSPAELHRVGETSHVL
ncbi:MAG TPA: hypothetical protein VJS42_17320 [Steroidobacteraceae bacterium]|nr:hypothetical protein [Steroidobacteraceae bacterium]